MHMEPTDKKCLICRFVWKNHQTIIQSIPIDRIALALSFNSMDNIHSKISKREVLYKYLIGRGDGILGLTRIIRKDTVCYHLLLVS